MDPRRIAAHVIDILGGRDAAFKHFDTEFRAISERWNQDSEIIGRILKAHLFVEHFLNEYLIAKNPNLGSTEEARLTFFQKLVLISHSSDDLAYLIPGIKRLNQIRNRIAHNLGAEITKSDVDVFMSIKAFKAMRNEQVSSEQPSKAPVDIIEDFSRFAGIALQATINRNNKLWEEAFRRAEAENDERDET